MQRGSKVDAEGKPVKEDSLAKSHTQGEPKVRDGEFPLC